jgi:hypothetical protein
VEGNGKGIESGEMDEMKINMEEELGKNRKGGSTRVG